MIVNWLKTYLTYSSFFFVTTVKYLLVLALILFDKMTWQIVFFLFAIQFIRPIKRLLNACADRLNDIISIKWSGFELILKGILKDENISENSKIIFTEHVANEIKKAEKIKLLRDVINSLRDLISYIKNGLRVSGQGRLVSLINSFESLNDTLEAQSDIELIKSVVKKLREELRSPVGNILIADALGMLEQDWWDTDPEEFQKIIDIRNKIKSGI